MNMKLLSLLGILLSFNTFADGMGPSLTSQDQPWSITASFGNGTYKHIQNNDKQTAVGRLALGNEMMLAGDYALGLELGVQNGNRLCLRVPQDTSVHPGDQGVHTTLAPMLDFLITAKSDPLAGSSFFAQLKGGLAYRYWQMNQPSMTDISQLTGEIQAGLGYPISALANLSVLYQGIYGNDPFLSSKKSPYNSIQLNNIPPLHAVLLAFSVNL